MNSRDLREIQGKMLVYLGPRGFYSKETFAENKLTPQNRPGISVQDEGRKRKCVIITLLQRLIFPTFSRRKSVSWITCYLIDAQTKNVENKRLDIAFVLSRQIVNRSLIVFPPKQICPHPKSTYASSQLHLRILVQDCSLIHMHRLTHWISDILPCTRRKQPLESNETIRPPCSPCLKFLNSISADKPEVSCYWKIKCADIAELLW